MPSHAGTMGCAGLNARQGATWQICEFPAQDLLAWLEDNDMQNGTMPAGSPKPLALPGEPRAAAPKHQQAAEVPLHRPSVTLDYS